MKKLLALTFAFTVLAFVFSACGGAAAPAEPESSAAPVAAEAATTAPAAPADAAPAGEKIVLRLAHAAGMEEPTHLACVFMQEELAKRSNGQIEVQLFPAGQLGDQIAVIEGLMNGTIDLTINSAVTVSNWVPQLKVLDLPYLISNNEEADALFQGEVGKMLLDSLSDVGLVGLGWGENGFRQIYNNVRPIVTAADMNGMKIRSMETPISVQMFESWGVSPTVIAWMETYTALQQGTVDGGDGPTPVWSGSQMGTVVKYISMTNHLYTAGLVVGSKMSFDKLPPETVELIKQVGDEAGVYMRGVVRSMESEALASLETDGAVTNIVSDEVRAELAAMAADVYAANREEIGAEFFDQVMSILGK